MKKMYITLACAVLGFAVPPPYLRAEAPQEHDSQSPQGEQPHTPLQVTPEKPPAGRGDSTQLPPVPPAPDEDPGYQETWRIGTGQSR